MRNYKMFIAIITWTFLGSPEIISQPTNNNLLIISKEGDISQIPKIIKKNKFRLYDESGNTPIHYLSSRSENEEKLIVAISRLIRSGLKVNSLNNEKESPLHLALEHYNFKIAKFLIRKIGKVYGIL